MRSLKLVSRSIHCAAVCATVLAALATMSVPSQAQSLLDFLFGSPKPVSRPAPPQRLAPPPMNNSVQYFNSFGNYNNYSAYSAGRQQSRGSSRTYRTMCVRTCDGYYFPINYRTQSGYLHRDADECSSRCGGNGRLFYYPTGATDIKQAVDLSGLAYSSLKTAFLYRKKYVASCTCRPHPWSEAEKNRHRRYANAENTKAPPIQSADAGVGAATYAAVDSGMLQDAPEIDGKAPAATSVSPTQKPPAEMAETDVPESVYDVTPVVRPEPVSFTRSEPVRRSRASQNQRARHSNQPMNQPRSTPSPAAKASQANRSARSRPSAPKSGSQGFSLFSGTYKPKYAWPGDPR